MDGFSMASISSACSSLSHRALSAASEIDDLVKHQENQNDVPERLVFLGTTLHKFCKDVDHLETSLRDAVVLSPSLQAGISKILLALDMAISVVTKEILRITPGTKAADINLQTVAKFQELVMTHQRTFQIFHELLSM
jgi:hypothetical protein